MKLTIEKNTLNNVMKKAAKVASPKSTMPILTHVALDFDGVALTITANDSARTYSETVPAEGEPGQCTIEAAKLSKAVSGMKSGDLELTPGQIKQGRSKLKLESRNYADFPQPDYAEAEDSGLTGEQLAEAISVIGHAMPQKDVRPMLNGIHLTAGYAVATDGHRMAFVEVPYQGPDIIIPADSARQMGDMGGKVMVSASQLIIDGGGSRFSTNLVESKYPDWRRVRPTEFESEATVNAGDLLAACRTVQLGGTMAKFEFADGDVRISNDEAESMADATVKESLVVGFNVQYVIDAIVAADSPEITIKLNAGKSSEINGAFVVMPVRL